MRLGTYFRTLVNTLTNPKYYVDVLNVRFWFTTRFLILSYLLLTLINGTLFSLIDIPKLRSSLTSFLNTEAERYPADFVVYWNGQAMALNTGEKYVVPFPKLPDAQGLPPQLLEINPKIKDASEITQTQSEKSLVVFGADRLYLAQPGGGWNSLFFEEVFGADSFSVTKGAIESQLPRYREQLNTTLRAFPFLYSAFFFFISFPFRLLSVVIDSLLIFFMIKISGLPLTLKKVTQISLHIMVAAELITTLTANFGSGLQMFSIAFWLYTFMVYWNLRNIRALTPDEAERLHRE